ncbi:MAG: ACT domain-containing protein [Bacillota bacterium]
MNKATITVSGHDHVGIVANISQELSKYGINIIDISQTVMSVHFTMVMAVDLSSCSLTYDELSANLKDLADQLNLTIRMERK